MNKLLNRWMRKRGDSSLLTFQAKPSGKVRFQTGAATACLEKLAKLFSQLTSTVAEAIAQGGTKTPQYATPAVEELTRHLNANFPDVYQDFAIAAFLKKFKERLEKALAFVQPATRKEIEGQLGLIEQLVGNNCGATSVGGGGNTADQPTQVA